MKKIFFLLAATTFFLSGCKKNGGGGGNTTPDTYLPSNDGTKWVYKVTEGGVASPDVTYTMGSLAATVNGRTYKVATASPNPPYSNRNFAQETNNYWTTVNIMGNDLELNILQADKDVNGTWTSSQTLTGLSGLPGGITSATIDISYKITQKGGSLAVNGVTYNDVIKVDITSITATPVGIPFPLNIGTANFTFAKNIGLIQMASNISNSTIGISQNDNYELDSYDIK
ncbi:MAG: hypothetical protein KF781_02115 [Chitinophagaceae bacterium]|nr:hypothetical protein [Chitinophagaceae bacterium]MCW5904304.1 hypothetical protein [Chitinophagaceae bacterium]